MELSQPVIDELAVASMRLHRALTQRHLELMIQSMQRSGDRDGAADYERVLNAVRARQDLLTETA